jgi:hypothetical protein
VTPTISTVLLVMKRITGEVDDTIIGDLNTYFDFAKFTKA